MKTILSLKKVMEITGLSRTTIYRLERDGQFPKRGVIGKRKIGWLSVDVEKWIDDIFIHTKKKEKLLFDTIEGLKLSRRAFNCLKKAGDGYYYLNDLANRRKYDILSLQGCGRNSFEEIIAALCKRGILLID